MAFIKLGSVRAFPSVKPDKEQALKVLEEAAEVFGEWQLLCGCFDRPSAVDCVAMEIADVVTACCNLASALGIEDMKPYLERCEESNRKRGRYGDQDD